MTATEGASTEARQEREAVKKRGAGRPLIPEQVFPQRRRAGFRGTAGAPSRPGSGHPRVAISFPPAMLEAVDELAAQAGVPFAEQVRRLIAKAMEARS